MIVRLAFRLLDNLLVLRNEIINARIFNTEIFKNFTEIEVAIGGHLPCRFAAR